MSEYVRISQLNVDAKGLEPDVEWENAACVDADKDLFFSADGEHKARWRARQVFAKTICSRCVILEDCLTHAISTGEIGIWGGTDDDEREAILDGRAAS